MLTSQAILSLIGIVAGAIFFMDGWAPSGALKKLSMGRRYRGLITLFSGGLVTGLIDLYQSNNTAQLLNSYGTGALFGFAATFALCLLLYVVWKETRHLPLETHPYKFGHLCFSILEFLWTGLGASKQVQEEIERLTSQVSLWKEPSSRIGSPINREYTEPYFQRSLDLSELKVLLLDKEFPEQLKLVCHWLGASNRNKLDRDAILAILLDEYSDVMMGVESRLETIAVRGKSDSLLKLIFHSPEPPKEQE